MASEEGNKGIKQKFERTEERNEDKRFYLSTSLETKQDEAPRNLEGTKWMKYCNISNRKAEPQCAVCEQYHSFYIESTTFKEHLAVHYPNFHKEQSNDEFNWIFRYFKIVNAQTLECRLCKHTDVLKFDGPLVKHFNKQHDKYVKRGCKDVEEVRKITADLISYLHSRQLSKHMEGNENKKKYEKNEEENKNVKQKAWWMKYVNKVEKDTVFCGIDTCLLFKRPISVGLYFFEEDLESHVQLHLPEIKLGAHMNNWEHFLFEKFQLKCKYCHQFLDFNFYTKFTEHLLEKHGTNFALEKVTEPKKDGESSQEINNDANTNELIKTLMTYLIATYVK